MTPLRSSKLTGAFFIRIDVEVTALIADSEKF
jgi:hypothetical protein